MLFFRIYYTHRIQRSLLIMKFLKKLALLTLIFTMCISTTTYANPNQEVDTIFQPLDCLENPDKLDEFL